VDDEALLGKDPVTQQWKGSDRCYAMAQYTGVNNGAEYVFCGRCGGYITSDNSTEVQCKTIISTTTGYFKTICIRVRLPNYSSLQNLLQTFVSCE
jgi:hypothetical protein